MAKRTIHTFEVEHELINGTILVLTFSDYTLMNSVASQLFGIYYGYGELGQAFTVTIQKLVKFPDHLLLNRFLPKGISGYKAIIFVVKDTMKYILDHEMCHARFFLERVYRNKAIKAFNKIPQSVVKKVKSGLAKLGYSEDRQEKYEYLIEDESQAYFRTSPLDELVNLFPDMSAEELVSVRNILENQE